jgi:hypothetical protein
MNTQLLIETYSPEESNIISEMFDGGKKLVLRGIFMQAEIKNRNNRIYPLAEMANLVNQARAAITQYGGIFGEADHPSGLQINMDRISHAVKELKMEGNNAVGLIEVLDTPMGLILKELARSKVRFGVSSRCTGSLNESGIVSNARFITLDAVATPSAIGAYPDAMYESLQNFKEGKITSLYESVRNDKSAQKYLSKEIKNFVQKIVKK